jgi:hypothetical protein
MQLFMLRGPDFRASRIAATSGDRSSRTFSPAFAIVIAFALIPARALAQRSSIPPGKALEYRLIDGDTGEELFRHKIWRSADPPYPSQWNETTFPNGDRTIAQCIKGNGAQKPATMRLAVTLNAAGAVDESSFETFEPSYYPFLHRPLPSRPMESLSCFTARGLDYAALQRGDETSLFVWLNDVIYFRLFFRMIGKDTVSVPAGKFEALKVHVKLDMATFFPNLLAWAAKMMGLFVPDIDVWVVTNDRGDFEMVRQAGFPIGKHKHTVQELTGTSDTPTITHSDLELLQAAKRAPAQPKMVVDETGSFTVGALRGRAILSSGIENEGPARLLAVRTQFSNGLALEGSSLVNYAASPKTSYMEQRAYAPDGTLVERKHLAFRLDSFPLQPEIELPDDLYASSQTLAEVVPDLKLDSGGEARFHVLGFDGVVNQIAMWQDGSGAIAGQDAAHLKLKTIIDLPFYLRPLAYFLVPTFDAYVQGAPPHRLLEFTGPFGPPGSDPTHFIADASVQNAPAEAEIGLPIPPEIGPDPSATSGHR